MTRSLVSMTVICYQAERYVREAIAGALAQTYRPLEIIFSDDASTDRTFEIIEEAVRGYRGPHKIVTNRNATNLGIGAHVSKVWFDIAEGDWIVVSAGDDVSLPHRVARLMEVATGDIGAVHHSCTPIDENSKELPYLPEYAPNLAVFAKESVEDLVRERQWLKGATMCLNKKMLLKYGRINPDVANEDNVLCYRAQAYGGIKWLDEPLMRYRIHGASVTMEYRSESIESFRGMIVKRARTMRALNRQILDDSRQIAMPPALLEEIRRENLRHDSDLFLFAGGPFRLELLGDRWFYLKLGKRLLFKPYWYWRQLRHMNG